MALAAGHGSPLRPVGNPLVVTLFFIETQCFTVEDRSLFLGTIEELRAHLDQLSAQGWMVAAGFEVLTGLPARPDVR